MNELSAVALCLGALVDARGDEFSKLRYLVDKRVAEIDGKEKKRFVVKQESGFYGYNDRKSVYIPVSLSIFHPQGWEFDWGLCVHAYDASFEISCSVGVLGDGDGMEIESHDVFYVSESVNTVDQAVESITRLSKLVCAQTQFLDLFLQPALTWQDFPLID